MPISNLALAFGSSLTAGLNLYLTVLTLGLLGLFEFLELPSNMAILSNPWVLSCTVLLFVVEFVTDKIPFLDNTWDTIHSFIRIPAGALLSASAVGDIPGQLLWVAALAGGFASLSSHGAKASTRLAINTTPEPFTNWFVSLVEDGLTLVVLGLVTTHPYVALALMTSLQIGFLFLIYLFYRFFKMLFRWQKPLVQDPD